jgi:hypothetical protein
MDLYISTTFCTCLSVMVPSSSAYTVFRWRATSACTRRSDGGHLQHCAMSNLGSFVSHCYCIWISAARRAIQDFLGVDNREEQFVVHARLRTPSPERLACG